MAARIQLRRDTAASWTAVNPILAQGEQGYETDTKKLKVGDGVTAWNLLAYNLSDPNSIDARGGRINQALVQQTSPYGREVIAYDGDSITNGSASTNAGVSAFRTLEPLFLGSGIVGNALNLAVAGRTSAQTLAALPAALAGTGATIYRLMIGTNDAGNGVPLATFMANVQAIVAYAKNQGCKVAVSTVPPRGAGAGAAIQKLIDQYNLWLRAWVPAVGTLLDGHLALVDFATGYMKAAYDSGDGIHPNDAGHRNIADVGTPALAGIVRGPINRMVDAISNGWGLIADPMHNTAAGWNVLASFQAAVVNTLQPAVNGDLAAGQWYQAAIAAAAAAANTTIGKAFAGWAVGDKLLAMACLKDSANNGFSARILNQNSTGVAFLGNGNGIAANANTTPSQKSAVVFAVPAGTTSLSLAFTFGWNQGDTKSVSIGNPQVFNLTQMGLDALIT